MATPPIPAQYLLSRDAPSPRTLIDILHDTAARYPDAPAIDDGAVQLTYGEITADIRAGSRWLAARGIGRGDRVGIRMPSGSYSLYLAILSVLATGAAYVPVDADDPDDRAHLVFTEAGVAGVITEAGLNRGPGSSRGWSPAPPQLDDDAWIIFTSGSTGTPKGVAVTHRNAAAFVDAEARMFLQHNPIGPGDRVLAGLSVAFDASCEEMWLAWRHGACLVPAPRALVRSGMDLGPWLVSRDITVVSTVPTLAALWPAEALEAVRLLIFGGEACPPDLADRLAVDGREVWNTYGPTEATVVSCGAQLTGNAPVSIGLPLPGWDLAVVDGSGEPVAIGGVGELVIGGVGLARYLDPEKDAEKYAPMPTLGWARAYRSGDLVRLEPDGLYFQGRADDQVKVGGRRIELGEVDAALVHLPGVSGGAAAVRKTASGTPVLVGYIASAEPSFDLAAARRHLADALPAALVPRLVLVDELPTRTSGKVDRDALPWPPPGDVPDVGSQLGGTMAWLAARWQDILGAVVDGPEADFFALGGGSLAAAQMVVALRDRYPAMTVAASLRPPATRLAGRFPRRDGRRPTATGGRRAAAGGTHTGLRPGGPGRPFATAGHPRRAAVGHLACADQQRGGLGAPVAVADHGQLVAGRGSVHRCSSPRWAGWPSPWSGARVLLAGLKPGTYRRGGSAASAGMAGRATGRRPAEPRTSPVPRGWCTTPGRSAIRWARESICIPPRRSPECSRSATVVRSNRRST